LLDNPVRLAALYIDHKACPAGVFFKRRVVETLFVRVSGIHGYGLGIR
jgi:hypothetical protein